MNMNAKGRVPSSGRIYFAVSSTLFKSFLNSFKLLALAIVRSSHGCSYPKASRPQMMPSLW